MHEDLSDIIQGLGALLLAGAAIAVAAASGAGYAYLVPDEVVSAAIAQEVHERACIAQGSFSERLPKPVCALGTRDVPATALPYPTAAAQAAFWSTQE